LFVQIGKTGGIALGGFHQQSIILLRCHVSLG
jgi:hypothetical protein